jgi:hypothetical protein
MNQKCQSLPRIVGAGCGKTKKPYGFKDKRKTIIKEHISYE